MENLVIFASSINNTMSDYHIHLDDDLIVEVKKLFGTEESFQNWLQQKIEQWLLGWLKGTAKEGSSRGGLSDEELAERLKDYPPLTLEAFPELSESEFLDMIKSQAGRLPEGLEDWL